MQTQLEKIKIVEKSPPSFFVIIIKDPSEKELLGAKSSEWVGDAVKGFSSIIVEKTNEEGVELAKRYLTNSTYTIVLSGNLPLLTHSTFSHLVEYVTFKCVKACKFMGGAVYNTEYLKNTKQIFYDSVYTHKDEDFYLVENAKQMSYAIETLKNRIIDFHITNGVTFKNLKNVIIEKDVVIDKGVVIDCGNNIKSKSHIKSNAIIKENNVIANSIIGKNSCIANSTIEDSKLGDDCIIMPYTNISHTIIGNNVVVFGNMSLINRVIKDNRKMKNKEVDK